MNAFKHGRRSRQLMETAALLASDRQIAESMAKFGARVEGKQLNRLQAGAAMLRHLITQAHAAGAARALAGDREAIEQVERLNEAFARVPVPPVLGSPNGLNADHKHLMDQQTTRAPSPDATAGTESDTESGTPNPLGEKNHPQTNREQTQTAANESPSGIATK
jgi:hypothetical protein